MDMSTMQCFREVIEAGTEEEEPDAGSMMCKPWWPSTETEEMPLAAKVDDGFFSGDSFASFPPANPGKDVGVSSGRSDSCLSGSFRGVEG